MRGMGLSLMRKLMVFAVSGVMLLGSVSFASGHCDTYAERLHLDASKNVGHGEIHNELAPAKRRHDH